MFVQSEMDGWDWSRCGRGGGFIPSHSSESNFHPIARLVWRTTFSWENESIEKNFEAKLETPLSVVRNLAS